MAFQTESAGHRSAINVTPLIDVLLVLLIIFLVVMPLMLRMITVNVPSKEPGDPPGLPLVVKVHADLTLSVDDDHGEREIVLKELPPIVARQKARMVYVDFDPQVPWSLAVSTFDSIRSVATDANHDEVRVLLRMRDE